MNRIVAALALLLLFCAPASAAITQIVGTGTGGSVASSSNNSSILTVVATTTVDIPPGNLIVVGLGLRAAAVYTGCVDSASNTYTIAVSRLGTGVAVSVAYSINANDLPNGGTITCTNTGTQAKGIIVSAWSGASATPLDAASATPANNTGTAVSVGPTGTLGCPGAGNCEVLIGFFSHLSLGTVTEDAGFTSLGSVTANAGNVHMAYKLVSASTAVTYAPTNSASAAWAATLEGFVQSTASAIVFHGLSSTGAGK